MLPHELNDLLLSKATITTSNPMHTPINTPTTPTADPITTASSEWLLPSDPETTGGGGGVTVSASEAEYFEILPSEGTGVAMGSNEECESVETKWMLVMSEILNEIPLYWSVPITWIELDKTLKLMSTGLSLLIVVWLVVTVTGLSVVTLKVIGLDVGWGDIVDAWETLVRNKEGEEGEGEEEGEEEWEEEGEGERVEEEEGLKREEEERVEDDEEREDEDGVMVCWTLLITEVLEEGTTK